MLIKALCDYADKREKGRKDKVIPDGWCEQEVHFKINLSPDGKIVSIDDVREERKGINVVLPKRNSKSAPSSETIEHRAKYIFGLTLKKDGSFELADKFHKKFKEHELDFFSDLDSEICCAYKNFIQQWNPKDEMNNSELLKLGKDYENAYFRFALTGGRGFLEEDEQFIVKYTQFLVEEKRNLTSDDTVLGICGILGEKLPIAKNHDKITKNPLSEKRIVCMKEDVFQSYGKKESYNSNISVKAMEKYTATLNELLADRCHSVSIDDMVIVFFAMKADDTKECELMWSFLSYFPSPTETEQFMQGMFEKVQGGAMGDTAYEFDRDIVFFIAGLTAANRSRICQKFLYRNTFGIVIDNITQHQKDLQISSEKDKQIYFSQIKKELISPKSTSKSAMEKVPPPLMTSILMSALNGTDYPNALLETVVRRVKTDRDDKKNHFFNPNDTRAGIIKACINRKLRKAGKKEEITMALNQENKNSAYLCGRLFAVLEKIQKDSVEKSGGKIDRTIKDAYFASACARPSAIMTKLLQLSQHHLHKLRNLGEEGKRAANYHDKMVCDIVNDIADKFPQTLDLDSQGKFIVGYYQQNKALYTSNKQND